jgi:hypothetical protein
LEVSQLTEAHRTSPYQKTERKGTEAPFDSHVINLLSTHKLPSATILLDMSSRLGLCSSSNIEGVNRQETKEINLVALGKGELVSWEQAIVIFH